MLHDTVIDKLDSNRAVFSALLENVSSQQAGWKPSPDKWSILEVVNHLYDEERLDFRQRLEFALLRPDKPWQRISPKDWVVENRYYEKEMKNSLENFLAERVKSIDWLKGLSSPDWHAIDNYPHGKTMTAGQILVNWLAHDYLHIRQLNALNRNYLSEIAAPIDLRYAGNW